MQGPLSILIVLHDFALGGTERIALRLAKAWTDAGAEVTIFCGRIEGPLRPLAGDAVAVVGADPAAGRRPSGRRALARAAGAYAAAHRHDVAFVPGNFHWPAVPRLARALPVVAQVSAALEKPQRPGLRQRAFERRMRRQLRSVGAVVTLAPAFAAQARRILGPARIVTIPLPALDGLDAPRPAIAEPHILAAGRLVPEKGFAMLIDAFARLDRPDARLKILGHGPQRGELQAQIDRLGLAARVALPGYVPDIRPHLDAARLFVLSSQHEGYCAVIVEALAAGRPVVATDCTPATALLADGGGTAVPIDDAPAMAAAIARELDRAPPDPATLAARVVGHRIGPVARAYLDLFAAVAR